MDSVPPAPDVVAKTCVHVVASLETSMLYAVANAASHWIEKPLIDALAPRSACSHCGSLNADDHRVVASPSTAAEAGVDESCTEEAVAVDPSEMFGTAVSARAIRWNRS